MKNLLNGLLGWTDARFPLTKMWNEHLADYYAPKNLNFWYFFGSLALLVLVNQILTGIWLTMSYKPDAELAFASVEFIMRDVEWGWLIRYLHSTGASAFFVVVYLHMFRGLMYGSYKQPRELLWLVGMLIYLMLMAEAFMGYLLPWGQMSYWGAQVIVSLFGAIPVIGEDLTLWIRGDYVVSDATLNRFFALHVIALPIALLGLVVVHIIALHEVGSNNPDGVEIKKNKNEKGKPVDGIPFHPYYTVKDMVGVVAFLFLFSLVVFFWPEMGGWFLEKDNFIPANPLKTPEHIVPLWYFTPFYAILRAIPDKLTGVLAMGASIVMLFLIPWLEQHPVKSVRYRSLLYKMLLGVFVVTFVILGWLGTQPAMPVLSELGMRLAELYFGFFLILWLHSKEERPSGTYFGVFIGVLIVVLLVDITRFSSDNMALIVISSLIPIVYFGVFILGSLLPTLNKSKSVPDRLTVK
ncbi:MAG: cytochrome b N-terminal domain-containing protein [Gammaproteobacteria bacterium]|nr:cytochrome b N-terminal domain-containing protein [Gammaproteobacteria bacterium]NNJ85446.1 cytochrome b [Gammaproteobacteria bacterium]